MPTSSKDHNERRQYVREKAGEGAIVVNSPYGNERSRYGWGHLFGAPMRATVPGYPNIHIGLSSLNAVSAKGDRAMSGLLEQYRRKFNALEHCYTYHKVSELSAWQSWGSMVSDSNTPVILANEKAEKGKNENHSSRHSISNSNSNHPHNDNNATSSLLLTGASTINNTSSSVESSVNPYRFIYTIKANNFLTHHSKLEMTEVVERHIDSFFGERCAALHPFLGPILLQLPPYFHRSAVNMQRLEQLNARLPHNKVHVTVQDSTRGGGGFHDIQRKLIRIAVEFRHDSWLHPEVYELLRKLGWALVITHEWENDKFSSHIDTGVPFMYVRLHGAVGTHVGDYGPVELDKWANMIKSFVNKRGENSSSSSSSSEQQHHYSTNVIHDKEKKQKENDHNDNDDNEVNEVYFFFNNNESQINGATSSVVDATYLAHRLQEILPHHKDNRPEVVNVRDNVMSKPALHEDKKRERHERRNNSNNNKMKEEAEDVDAEHTERKSKRAHASQVIDVDDDDNNNVKKEQEEEEEKENSNRKEKIKNKSESKKTATWVGARKHAPKHDVKKERSTGNVKREK